MNKFISLRAIQEIMAKDFQLGSLDEDCGRRLWWGALETLQQDILNTLDLGDGLWLSSPLPALYEPYLLNNLQGWVWTPDELDFSGLRELALLPPVDFDASQKNFFRESKKYIQLPLRTEDGLDPMLIIITQKVQIALSLKGPKNERRLLMRSDRKTLSDLLSMLDQRLIYENTFLSKKLRESIKNLGNLKSNNIIENIFWPMLSSKLASMAPSITIQSNTLVKEEAHIKPPEDITLLEAITHEVRTPLATIRTLIRSIIKRNDIPSIVLERLKEIDHECTEQIDRFGLIFNAAELERQEPELSHLASTDLGRMLKVMEPIWLKQLERKGIRFKLLISPDLPFVLSDPERLKLMLSGLIDRNSRGLNSGSVLALELSPAGQRLKLQLTIQTNNSSDTSSSVNESHSSLGTVLSWNPKTGSLQLSQAATQRLLESLGGRLKRGVNRGLTVFFPVSGTK